MQFEHDPDLLLRDLVTAYRKAKVDLFYNDNPRRMDLLRYEESLAHNLHALRDRLIGADESWIHDSIFLGGFTFFPKSLKEPEIVRRSLWSAPAETWRHQWDGAQGKRPRAEFRLMAICSIDLHVLSTLWMLHVGALLDMQLSGSPVRSVRFQVKRETVNFAAAHLKHSCLPPITLVRSDAPRNDVLAARARLL